MSASTVYAQAEQVQAIPLTTGWNLISIQIGGSLTPQEFQNKLQTNGLLSIWGYDALTHSWQSFQATNSAFPHDLTSLVPGRGYWVRVSRANTLTLSGTAWNGSLTLQPGWNLVGFQGLALGENEQLDFTSIFRDSLPRIPQVWTWDGGSAQRFRGFDSAARPPITELSSVEPGKGYWVFSLDSMTLSPQPLVALEADGDISPLQVEVPYNGNNPRYTNQLVREAGLEDSSEDLNHNFILDNPYTQDVIVFKKGVNQKLITIANSGLGLLDWSIVSTVPWLGVDKTSGVTGTEQDTVRLTVYRTNLAPGFYYADDIEFLLSAGGRVFPITIYLEVPTVAGDYRGYASAQRVNGREIALGKVDLNLSIFNEGDATGETRFRGVINRDKALLFPKDVFMTGVFYQGLDFSLTTSFEMPVGDRNAPPYGTFTHNTNNIGVESIFSDRDYNRDGVLNNENIFPFAIRREVTLLGTRTTADRLEGTYIEAIQGVLPGNQRIYIEGSFTLDRESLVPTRKSIYSGRTNTIVAIGGSTGGRSSYTNAISVNSDVRIDGAVLTVNFDFPKPLELEFYLYGPGRSNVVHLTNITSGSSIRLADFNDLLGRGRWELVTSWNPLSGERGFFTGWELRLEGLAFYTVRGSVVTVNGSVTNAVSGASVALAGSNIIPLSNTATNGQFAFASLSENDYFITVSKFGYQTATRAFSINATDVELGAIVLAPIAVATPQIQVAPYIGQAPLYVTFTPLIPAATLGVLGTNVVATWNFGDGSPVVTTQAVSVAHSYLNGGSFRATLTLAGSLASTNFTTDYLTALAAAPNFAALPSATAFVFGGGFLGSIASPNSSANVIEKSMQLGVTNAYVHQESKRDSAAFDIDRFPFGGSLGSEDTDFFTQTNTLLHLQRPVAAIGLDTNIVGAFRMISTFGGFVCPPETWPWTDTSARVGTFNLQVGRIED